ncbi:MAG: hypothetical protein BWX70_00719 [Verrucomicrobia bacterium ADurb.Bin070]|nr:MAG: hypothetical protein BWX70_00719 [Verrucomicrobia bacterium ADurb.Bin070]
MDGIQHGVGGVHVLGHRLLGVGILAGGDGMHGVARMLEVGGGDDHGVYIFRLFVEILIALVQVDTVTDLLFDPGLAFGAALAPEVGQRNHVEVQFVL